VLFRSGQAAAMGPLDGRASEWLVEGTNSFLVVSPPAAGTNFNIPGPTYLTDVSVTAVAVARLTGASTPDIAAVGTEAAGPRAYVLINNGSGAFNLPQKLPVTGTPLAVAAGDLNGGGLDLVVATGGTIQIFLNTGGGNFELTAAHQYDVPATVTAIALADFNSDGKLDVATSSRGVDEVSVLTGNGDGTFNPPVVFAAGQVVSGIGVADFNRDNKPDIVVAGFYGIYLLQNSTM